MATWLLDLREFDAVEPYGVRAATFLELSCCGCALPQCFPCCSGGAPWAALLPWAWRGGLPRRRSLRALQRLGCRTLGSLTSSSPTVSALLVFRRCPLGDQVGSPRRRLWCLAPPLVTSSTSMGAGSPVSWRGGCCPRKLLSAEGWTQWSTSSSFSSSSSATWQLDLREFDAVEPYGVRAAFFRELSYCGWELDSSLCVSWWPGALRCLSDASSVADVLLGNFFNYKVGCCGCFLVW